MPSAKGLRGVLRSGPLLLMLGLGSMAVSMAGPSLGLTGASGGAIPPRPQGGAGRV